MSIPLDSHDRLVNLPALNTIRQSILRKSSEALEKNAPLYVAKLREAIASGNDLQEALTSTTHHLGTGLPKGWGELITIEFDYELSIDKVGQALSLLKHGCPQGLDTHWDENRWTSYHCDHFIFQFDAFLKRLEKLVKRTCRQLLQPTDQARQKLESDLTKRTARMKGLIGKLRDPLAHGGGPVSAPAELNLWEPLLAVGADIDAVPTYYSHLSGFRVKWHKGFEATFLKALNESEQILAVLNQHIPRPPQGPGTP